MKCANCKFDLQADAWGNALPHKCSAAVTTEAQPPGKDFRETVPLTDEGDKGESTPLKERELRG